MLFTQFMTKAEDGTSVCHACQWHCRLQPGEQGQCLVRAGYEQGIAAHNHGLISAATVSPVEEFRLWHFFPDSLALAIGSWGYAFPADQQHGSFARIPEAEEKQRNLPPEKAAAFALKQLCRGVIWAYGEPAVAADYVVDLLKNSRASSRYTAIVTTGFLTEEVLNTIGLYLHGISLDLRGFGDVAYSRLAGIPEWRSILEIAALAKSKWHCHIEVTTRMHYGVNDKQEEVRALVDWIRETLGPTTPWHVLPGDAGASAAHATMRARRIGMEGGLHFVYGAEPSQETRCPSCQTTLITREDGVTRLVGLRENVCANCGFDTQVYLSIWQKK
jgi:pyruvate formate lyase activating enzyme